MGTSLSWRDSVAQKQNRAKGMLEMGPRTWKSTVWAAFDSWSLLGLSHLKL